MFSRIKVTSRYSSNEPYLDKLDILINKYNANQAEGIVDLISLQQINGLAEKLYYMVRADPPKDYGSDFMKWYNKKEINRELKSLSASSPAKSSKKQRIADISVIVPYHRKDFNRIPTPKELKKRVKKLFFFSTEPKYFSDLRMLLQQFHELDPNKLDFNWGKAIGQLELLQQKIVEILIDDIDLNERSDRILLERLLLVVNRTMNEFFRMNRDLSDQYLLMVGPDAKTKRDILNRLTEHQPLDFNLPVFTVRGADTIVDLIRAATMPNPLERISLYSFSEALNLVHHALNQEEHADEQSIAPISPR
ncbi:hypothetical protein ELY21_05940 [Legionella sp. km535]|uniref:hypothetical protein n=1 Tax=Legionella sp. km535 TaxID=2498107 RepID=UPI000F8D877B|nr:hypothetical protein [Legionella sp. km535]RUR19064.1 hypothetical protein ELY21_05940 [Legionella sp. km535]